METKVGTKVPMMLPMVLKAFSRPTTRPESSRLSTVYFTSEGVVVPSRKSGNTKMTMQARKPAQIRKPLLTVTTSRPEIPRMTYLPRNGIAAIQTAATSSRR